MSYHLESEMREKTKLRNCHINRGLLAAAGVLGLTFLLPSWLSPLVTLFITVAFGVTYLIFAVVAIDHNDNQRAIHQHGEPSLTDSKP